MEFELEGESLECSDGGGAEVVFHAFDIVVDGFWVEAEELEEIGEQLVAVGNVLGELFTRRGEDEASVFFVAEEAFGIEALDHVGDAGLRDGEAVGDVNDACVALGSDEFEDLLEVILDG